MFKAKLQSVWKTVGENLIVNSKSNALPVKEKMFFYVKIKNFGSSKSYHKKSKKTSLKLKGRCFQEMAFKGQRSIIYNELPLIKLKI